MKELIRRPLALLATLAVVLSGFVAAAPPAAAATAQTAGVPALYITLKGTYYRTTEANPTITRTSADGAFKAVNDSGSHTIAGEATYELVDPDNPLNNMVDNGTTDTTTGVTTYGEIRGRGNYTWVTLPNLWITGAPGYIAEWVNSMSGGTASFTQQQADKRPYQMKLSSKQNLLGMGSAKTWILLANHSDGSLMRNKSALDLAAEFGLPYTPQSRFIDLVVNGKYLGNYLLTEKVQEGGTRVPLKDATQQGILAELDNNYYGTEPANLVHRSPSGSHYVLKDAYNGDITDANGTLLPNVALGWRGITDRINLVDTELAKANPDWTTINNLIDVDSFIRFYFLQEFTENPEIARSSIYFYKDGPTDKLHAGPAWDFDSSLGNYSDPSKGGDPNILYTRFIKTWRPNSDGKVSNFWFQDLFKMPQFEAAAKTLYVNELKRGVDGAASNLGHYEALMSGSAAKNFARYPILGGAKFFPPFMDRFSSTFAGEVNRLRYYMSVRAMRLNAVYAPNVAANASDCASATASATINTPGAFNALTPCRMLDTRTGNGGQGPVASNGVLSLKVTNRGGVPANASAVVLNVTAANPTHQGFITAYPSGGGTAPDASNLNFQPGQVTANQVIVAIGPDGVVNLKNSVGGTVHLIADVSGFFLGGTVTAAGGFSSMSPVRVLDTRKGIGAPTAVVPGGTSIELQVTGATSGVPDTAGAVALNVTVTEPTAAGHITVYPTGTATVPNVSNVNYLPGETIPNAATVKLGTGGKLTLLNTSTGTVQLVVDVNGYYTGGTATESGMFRPITPTRILDSRDGKGMPKTMEWKAATGRMLNNFETIPLTVAPSAGGQIPAVTAGGPNAGAVVLNLTVANPTQAGFLTAYPTGMVRPATSSVNFAKRQTIPNLATVKVGSDGAVNLYSMSVGQINIIADAAGYYIK